MDTSADPGAPSETDADALKARRAALRAFVDDIASHVQTLDLPETYLEAERAARAITVNDRALQSLPLIAGVALGEETTTVVAPLRRHLRRYADRVMEAVTFITKPDSFLEGERAGRYALAADRMLSQLYEAPKPAKGMKLAFDDADEPEADDGEAQPNWRTAFIAKTDRHTGRYVRDCGVWPDGTPFDAEAPAPVDPWGAPDTLTLFQCLHPDSDPLQYDRWPAMLMLNRVNAVTRAMARRDGRWPDRSPFGEDDPDYYSLSRHFDERVLGRPPPKDADDPPPDHIETIGPVGFPAWMVRKVPP